MFFCPLTGQACFYHKAYSVYHLVNGHPVQMSVCQLCASKVVMQASANQEVWQNFVRVVFASMGVDKILTPGQLEAAVAAIKSKEELENFVNGLRRKIPDVSPCPSCGIGVGDILKTGRPGCPGCYKHYHGLLGAVVTQAQGGACGHRGKRPRQADLAAETSALEEEMRQAVRDERYEDAAKCRDRIRELLRLTTPADAGGQ